MNALDLHTSPNQGHPVDLIRFKNPSVKKLLCAFLKKSHKFSVPGHFPLSVADILKTALFDNHVSKTLKAGVFRK